MKFNYDNWLFNLINKIVYMTYASMLWLIFCIPIITAGASTTALYYVINKVIIHERGKIFQEFWCAFRGNFKQATYAWLIFLGINTVGLADFLVLYIIYQTGNISIIFLGLLTIILAITLAIGVYVYPQIARFENKLKNIFKNAIYLVIVNILTSIKYIILFLFLIIIFVLFPPSIAISPAIYWMCVNKSLENVFKKYMSAEELELEEDRNRKYIE